MPEIFVGGNKVRLARNRVIGKGGEADIYDIGGGQVLKLYKHPDHPDYTGLPHEQEGARQRLLTIQHKLPAFPHNLPRQVVAPLELATDASGKIVGYTMRMVRNAEVLMRYGERAYRDQGGLTNNMMMSVLLDLHDAVGKVHAEHVVLGDFNDLNVLVEGDHVDIVDIDSAQFGPYLTNVFTARFVDPTLCDAKAKSSLLIKPHGENSDWYAFTVMVMQTFLFIDPYGGVYLPKDQAKRIQHGQRPLKRVTVFQPEVRYPKAAQPWEILSDDLLEYLKRVFEKDERGVFPLKLLNLSWIKCPSCGLEHARLRCPVCSFTIVIPQQEKKTITDKVTVRKIMATNGTIVFAAIQGGKLVYLYHENGRYLREGGLAVITEALHPRNRFRLRFDDTLIGRDGEIRVIKRNGKTETVYVDNYMGILPMFDANESSVYWVGEDRLFRSGTYGPENIGTVLSGQTLFWVGSRFGMGFYRAGEISIAFVFDAATRAINDNVKITALRGGQLVDSTAVFTNDHCWFFVTIREGGKLMNRATMIGRDGTVVATAEAESGDSSWLGTIRGKTAAGQLLFAATDEGIVRVEAQNGTLVLTREFPATEAYVASDTQLFIGDGGIYAVGRKEILHLTLG